MEIGGVVAGVSDGTMRSLRAFAGELGHAFQLLDDLLNAGPISAVGKDRPVCTACHNVAQAVL